MDDKEPDNATGQSSPPPDPGLGPAQGTGEAYLTPNSPSQSPRGKEDNRFRLKLAIFWVGIVGAIVAAVAAGFPGWQNYIAQEEAKLQLRAYIDVRAKGMTRIEEGLMPRVHDSFHNIGRTPAYDNGSSAHVTVAEYPLAKKLVNDECSHARTTPNASKWFVGKVSRPETVREAPFTASEVEAIKDGKAAVYFHGRVCYRDIFNESHHTDFCTYWKWNAGRVSPGLYCDQGNSTD
ncbi:MAG: hypothetical protein K0S45_4384 [Nitrospira sp.]|jgi:hypothetical protein|nr:hypothetical protein [Nitrospira sp.]MCE3222551.1 hypothetical protein [Nitrospira sp.]